MHSAILCERRLIFVANNVQKLSTCVHAANAMLHPFAWQHIMLPVLPSNLISFASATMPYLIGVKRTLLSTLKKEVII